MAVGIIYLYIYILERDAVSHSSGNVELKKIKWNFTNN